LHSVIHKRTLHRLVSCYLWSVSRWTNLRKIRGTCVIRKMDLLKRAVWWSNRADCSRILDKRARISRAYSYRSPRRHGTRDSNRFRIPRWSSTALGERAIAPPGARVLCRRDTLRIRRRRATDRLYRSRSAPSSIPAFRTVSIASCNLATKRKLREHNI